LKQSVVRVKAQRARNVLGLKKVAAVDAQREKRVGAALLC